MPQISGVSYGNATVSPQNITLEPKYQVLAASHLTYSLSQLNSSASRPCIDLRSRTVRSCRLRTRPLHPLPCRLSFGPLPSSLASSIGLAGPCVSIPSAAAASSSGAVPHPASTRLRTLQVSLCLCYITIIMHGNLFVNIGTFWNLDSGLPFIELVFGFVLVWVLCI